MRQVPIHLPHHKRDPAASQTRAVRSSPKRCPSIAQALLERRADIARALPACRLATETAPCAKRPICKWWVPAGLHQQTPTIATFSHSTPGMIPMQRCAEPCMNSMASRTPFRCIKRSVHVPYPASCVPDVLFPSAFLSVFPPSVTHAGGRRGHMAEIR